MGFGLWVSVKRQTSYLHTSYFIHHIIYYYWLCLLVIDAVQHTATNTATNTATHSTYKECSLEGDFRWKELFLEGRFRPMLLKEFVFRGGFRRKESSRDTLNERVSVIRPPVLEERLDIGVIFFCFFTCLGWSNG